MGRFGVDFSESTLTPYTRETGPVKVRDRAPVWIQSPFPFLKTPGSGALPDDRAPAIKAGEMGFFSQTERKPKATLLNTSSPEVSKYKLSLSNGLEP